MLLPERDNQVNVQEFKGELLSAWRAHNDVNLKLIAKIPAGGFSAVPAGSRGRTVAEQFGHMNKARQSWLAYHTTGTRPRFPRIKGAKYSRKSLTADFRRSGKDVEKFFSEALAGKQKVRMFGGQVVRFATYLISHESHHRGSILLALKQNGMNKAVVQLQGLWWRWHRTK